jgi:hypothetical protein
MRGLPGSAFQLSDVCNTRREYFPRHNRAARKSKLKMQGAAIRRKSGETSMRQQQTPMNGNGQSTGYTFFFQIANDGERRACCVKVDAPNIHEASALFREKWPVIESMARDGVKTGADDGGVLTLVMP